MHSGSHSYTPTTPTTNYNHQIKQQPASLPTQPTVEQDNISITSNNSINHQIRSRINSLKNTAFSTPKFLRRKLATSDKQQSTDSQPQSLATTPNQNQPQTQQQQQQQH
jgi:hypothetical protein